MARSLLLVSLLCILVHLSQQTPAIPPISRDLAEDIAEVLSLLESTNTMAEELRVWVNDFYYTLLTKDVPPYIQRVDDILLALGVSQTDLESLKTEYASHVMDTKIIVDEALGATDNILSELQKMTFDLENDLPAVKVDFPTLGDAYSKQTRGFIAGRNDITAKVSALADTVTDLVEGMGGSEIDDLNAVLTELYVLLENHSDMAMESNFLFSSAFNTAYTALREILPQLPTM